MNKNHRRYRLGRRLGRRLGHRLGHRRRRRRRRDRWSRVVRAIVHEGVMGWRGRLGSQLSAVTASARSLSCWQYF